MSQLEKAFDSTQTGRHLIEWLISRADFLFLAYRCLHFVTSAHGPLERTSLILESLLPEFSPEEVDNNENVVEPRRERVYRRSMRQPGKFDKNIFNRGCDK